MNLSLHLQAWGDLAKRYGAIWRQAWAIRQELEPPHRLAHEVAFLPAHLEIAERPVHPAPSWTMRLLAVLSLIIVAFALFGRLDIVAVAQGRLIPNVHTKTVQPAVTGVVKRILVRDGDRVQAGQVLMELDPAQAGADADKAHAARMDALLAATRAQALLDAQAKGRAPQLAKVDAPAERWEEAQHLADGLYREYADKLALQQAELAKREAELATTRAQIDKLKQTAPLARAQAEDYAALSKGNFVARHDYLDKEQAAIGQEQELTAQRSHARELEAGIQAQRHEIESTTSAFRRTQLEELDKAKQQLAQTQGEETKAVTRRALMQLTAPVAGTVQQLAIHTVGGVVTTAQTLMTIVPDDTLEVEATLENKDVGFVHPGQNVIVKVEAFPYSRYGYLTGTVGRLANDATPDKKKGFVYVARIKLPTNKMKIEENWINLTPGMQVTAEIKTGRRTVAEYFLSPLTETAQESLRER